MRESDRRSPWLATAARSARVVALALSVAAGCGDSTDVTERCEDGSEPITLAAAEACVLSVVETGFLCAASRPNRYEREGYVVCSDAPLADADVDDAVTRAMARRGPPSSDELPAAAREAAADGLERAAEAREERPGNGRGRTE